jgi:hypothetical protein
MTGPATPTVFWACAAMGALMMVMTAAMANRWFRMFCSFAWLHAGVAACKAIQFIARGIVPAKKHDLLLHISVIF